MCTSQQRLHGAAQKAQQLRVMTNTQVEVQQAQQQSKMAAKMASRIKNYRVLGDVDEFQTKLAEVTVPPPPPQPDTVENTDPAAFPPEVWEAASISPDRGAAVIRAFREVLQTRCAWAALGGMHGQLCKPRCSRRTCAMGCCTCACHDNIKHPETDFLPALSSCMCIASVHACSCRLPQPHAQTLTA